MYDTQSSSKSRLKNDTIGEDGLRSLYQAYSDMGMEQFRQYCIALVESGGGNKPTKDAIINSIETAMNKDRMLKKANDFCFAGMGLGV
jgi:hypothetical protein